MVFILLITDFQRTKLLKLSKYLESYEFSIKFEKFCFFKIKIKYFIFDLYKFDRFLLFLKNNYN